MNENISKLLLSILPTSLSVNCVHKNIHILNNNSQYTNTKFDNSVWHRYYKNYTQYFIRIEQHNI